MVLGGTTESGRWDSDIEESVSYNILENCSKIMGSVKVSKYHRLFTVSLYCEYLITECSYTWTVEWFEAI